MFKTHESGKRFSFFLEPGEHNWDYVEVSLNLPWFYTTCSVTYDEGDSFLKTFCFSDVKQLNYISQQKNIKLKFVSLVSPNYLNGTDSWKVEPLKEIWQRVSENCPDQYEYVYLLKNGASYRDKVPPQPDNKPSSNKKIFAI